MTDTNVDQWQAINKISMGVGVTKADIDILNSHNDRIDLLLKLAVDDFFDHIYNNGFGHFFRHTDTEALKLKWIYHWNLLLAGLFDAAYQNYGDFIGPSHRRHNVDQGAYVQTYGWFIVNLVNLLEGDDSIDASDRRAMRNALLRLAFLDLTFAMNTFHVVFID